VTLSLKNVRRYARKSLASVLIMVCAVLAMNVLGGYIEGNLSVLENAFVRWGARGHLIVERPTSDLAKAVEGVGQIPLSEAEQSVIAKQLSQNPLVAKSARILRLSGMIDAGEVNTMFSGVGWEIAAIRDLKGPAYEHDVVAGHSLWQAQGKDSVVLGQGLARVIGCKVPDVGFAPLRHGESPIVRPFSCPSGPVQLSVSTLGEARVGADRFLPVGLMDWGVKDVNDRLVVMSLEQAQRLLNTRAVSEFHVLLKDGADINVAQQSLSATLKSQGLDLLVTRWLDRATFYHQVKDMMLSFLMFALTVSLIVAYMSLLNSSYLNFMQRTKELATLRSLGYSRRFVLALTALENAWLALFAGGLGIAGAVAIAYTVHTIGLSWTPPGSTNPVPIAISILPAVYIVSALVVVALAMVSSIIPTRKILRRSIVDSLSAV
jgi:putative ABC transport system permease protein